MTCSDRRFRDGQASSTSRSSRRRISAGRELRGKQRQPPGSGVAACPPQRTGSSCRPPSTPLVRHGSGTPVARRPCAATLPRVCNVPLLAAPLVPSPGSSFSSRYSSSSQHGALNCATPAALLHQLGGVSVARGRRALLPGRPGRDRQGRRGGQEVAAQPSVRLIHPAGGRTRTTTHPPRGETETAEDAMTSPPIPPPEPPWPGPSPVDPAPLPPDPAIPRPEPPDPSAPPPAPTSGHGA